MGGYRPSGQAAGLCLMLILPRPMAARRLVRVLACVALPFDPAEVHELAAAEVIVDNVGARVEAVQAKAFSLSDLDEGTNGTGCTPMHMAVAIWGRRQPDALAAHDASTASLIFPRALTGGLPWISMHKVSRRVWPGQPSYELDSLSRWRAWAGPRNPFTSPLPSGAEKEAELAAGLLVELLNDPALRDVAESIWLEETERRRLAGGAVENVACTDPVRAALVASSLPSKPLRHPPAPWDDQRDWAGVGLEDLWHFARFSSDGWITDAAKAELKARLASAKGGTRRDDSLTPPQQDP